MAVASRQRTISHFLFSPANFLYQKQHDCHPSLTLLFSASLNEDKTERKGSHFDTTVVIKADLHDFQDVLKKEDMLGTVHTHRRGLL
jgi:hypothetical protein